MTVRTERRAAPGQGRGRDGKRRAILDGALTVFAQEGYTRASIGTIAAESDTSTRTIYNHFGDKASLFRQVIEESAGGVADHGIALIEQELDPVIRSGDLAGLERYARLMATRDPASARHFAMVRQVSAEVMHIPQDVLAGWREAGPLRVHHALRARMERMAADGLIRVDHVRGGADRAATHFVELVATEVDQRTHYGAVPLPDDEIDGIVADGIAVFLRAYRA